MTGSVSKVFTAAIRTLPLLAGCVLSLFGAKCFAQNETFREIAEKPVLQLFTHHSQKQVLLVDGVLSALPNKTEHIKKTLESIDPKKEIILDLTGFSATSTYDLHTFMNEITSACEAKRNKHDPQQSCAITTFISQGNVTCEGDCLLTFMAGKKRMACSGAEFTFRATKEGGGPMDRAFREANMGIFIRSGMSDSWVKDHAKNFLLKRPTVMSTSELEGSNILTEINENCDYLVGTASGGEKWAQQ